MELNKLLDQSDNVLKALTESTRISDFHREMISSSSCLYGGIPELQKSQMFIDGSLENRNDEYNIAG